MTYIPTFAPPVLSAAECLWLWPTVMLRASDQLDRDFAERIEQQALRSNWVPSTIQLKLMRRMVKRYVPDGIRYDPQLIEPVENTHTKHWPDIPISPCERCNADGAIMHAASRRVLCSSCMISNRGRV